MSGDYMELFVLFFYIPGLIFATGVLVLMAQIRRATDRMGNALEALAQAQRPGPIDEISPTVDALDAVAREQGA